MKRYRVRPSVRPSVCPSMSPQQQTCRCRLAAVGSAGKIYRPTAAAGAGGGRMRAVPRCQSTYAAEQGLVVFLGGVIVS